MPIPSYKQIHIKSSERNIIFEQLDSHCFGQVPYLICIDHMSEQESILKSLEFYFDQKETNVYPYPVYIISNIENYKGELLIINSLDNSPQFFKQKIKQLNVKENKILQKIKLKQNSLQNIKRQDYNPFINNYAKIHKELKLLHQEQLFYDKLLEKMEKMNEQK